MKLAEFRKFREAEYYDRALAHISGANLGIDYRDLQIGWEHPGLKGKPSRRDWLKERLFFRDWAAGIEQNGNWY